MPGISAPTRTTRPKTRLAGCAAAVLGLLFLSSPGAALAQDARANSRITEADCRNRADTDEEVVVCGKRSGEDPYRIPKGLRQKPDRTKRGGTALAVEVMGSGIPGAASNIGAAGAAGSSKQLYEQWLAEREDEKKTQPQ